jgi:hypothetical protein
MIRLFYETDEPPIREGAQDGFSRLLAFFQGDPADGVRVTDLGGNAYEIEVDMDLDGNSVRETTILIAAQFTGDPLDGLDDTDFPVTAQLVDQSTPVGLYSANLTVTSLGGGAQGPTIFLVDGTSTLVLGGRFQSSSLSYTTDLTFAITPLYGEKDIQITEGSDAAVYALTYRSNTAGGQYTKAEGDINGSSFLIELRGPPLP